MATAKKTAAGNWCVQAYIGTDINGKKQTKRFYGATKKEAELAAAQFLLKKKLNNDVNRKTLEDAIQEYIDSKAVNLSPSTVRGYGTIKRNLPKPFLLCPLGKIDNKTLQTYISQYSKGRSRKTVENALGFLSGVFSQNDIELDLDRLTLPQKKKVEMYVPSAEDVEKILEYVKDTPFEVPVALAAYMGLRRGEIVALNWEDVDFEKDRITIDKSLVRDQEGVWHEKPPKSFAGNRTLTMPGPLREILERHQKPEGRVCEVNPHSLTMHFREKAEAAGVQPFNFHALRHFYASVLLRLNVPNKYAQRRMGHSSSSILERVYQHLMEDKDEEIDEDIDDFFS